jgi:hypothetical protein
MRTLNLSIITGALSTFLLLSACGGGGQTNVSAYTYGPLSETGTLVATGVSLVRRGSHVLFAGGKAAFYLESKTLNLQEFSGKRVHVEGTLERNVHEKYLPVLVVATINPADKEEGVKEWKLPGLSLTFSVPESWQSAVADRSASFTSPDAGSGTVFTIDAIDATGLPSGIPAVVAGNVAVKLRDVPVGEETHILRGGQVIRIKFTPGGDAADILREQYAAVLASMVFASSSSSASSTGSGSHLTPCGGSAGILCPAGYYCDVFDPQANIGKCRAR